MNRVPTDNIIIGIQHLSNEILSQEPVQQSVLIPDLLFRLWLIITLAILISLIAQLFRILWLYRSSRKESESNLLVLYSDKIKSPFSFFRLVFIPHDLEDSREADSIIIHESIHSAQFHSIDNLIMEVVSALMWFNPVVWMMKKSLHLVHEFLADEGTLNSGIELTWYQSLLVNQVTEEKLINIPSGFNNNLIKKRIIMMTKNNNKEGSGVGLLSLFMLTTTLFLAISAVNGLSAQEVKGKNENRKIKEEQKESSKEIKVVEGIKVVVYGEQKSQDTVIIKEGITIRSTKPDAVDSSVIYIVDGVHKNSIENINPDSIESVNVMKTDNLIVIRTKRFSKSEEKISIRHIDQSILEKTIFLVNNKEVSKTEFESLAPSQIESITVIKNSEQIKTLTGKDGDGLIMIKTKP